jgi:predicted amidohydrolase
VAVAQFTATLGDVDSNLAAVQRLLDEALAAGADTVVLPELCLPGYLLEASAYGEALLARVRAAGAVLQARSQRSGARIVYGTVQSHGQRLVNSVVLAEPDGTSTSYAKTHMVAQERAVFAAGPEVVVLPEAGLALGCCYDLAFPEPCRAAAVAGAGLLAVPMAWEEPRAFVLEAVAPARAVENTTYLACANQCGSVGGLRFHGGSRIIDPLGRELCRMAGEPGVVVADVDLGWVERLRDSTDPATYPLLADHRPGLALRTVPAPTGGGHP